MSNKIEIIIQAVDQATGTMNALRGRVQTMAKSIGETFSKIATLPNLIMGAGIYKLGKSFIEAADKIEVFRVQLLVVSKTSTEADEALSAIREWARVSPLETEDVVQAYVRLRAIGMSPTMEQMKVLGGVAIMFHRKLTDTLGGFVGLNTRTLREYGIEIDRTGKQAVIQSGNITKVVKKDSASIRQALIELWAERFPGALEKASETFGAKMEILRSNLFEFKAQVTDLFMPILGAAVDSISSKISALMQHIPTIVIAFANFFRVLELGFRGIVLAAAAMEMNVAAVLNEVIQTVISSTKFLFRNLESIIATMQGVLEKLMMAKWVPKAAKDDIWDAYRALNAVNGVLVKSTDTLTGWGEVSKSVFEEFMGGFIADGKAMEDAWIKWENVINKAKSWKSPIGGQLKGTGELGGLGGEDPTMAKKEKETTQDWGTIRERDLAQQKSYYDMREALAVTAQEKEFERYLKETTEFASSKDAMYLTEEQFQNRMNSLKAVHAANRKKIDEDEMRSSFEAHATTTSALMNLGEMALSNNKKQAKKNRDIMIAMAIIDAGGAAVTAVYSAMKSGGNVYLNIIRAVGAVASIVAMTAPRIASMQNQSFSTGTSFAPGGVARVHQDETIYLPRGSRVETARESRSGGNIQVNFNAPVTRESLPDIKRELRTLGQAIKSGIRGGQIRPSQIGLATA